MKRTMLAAAALLGGLAFTPETRADHDRWGFRVGFGFDGGFFQAGFGHRGHRARHHRAPVVVCPPVVVAPPVHVHHRAPVYTQVWVPARYERAIVGYDHCGRPVYRKVCVSAGHYQSVVSGYRCGCGHAF